MSTYLEFQTQRIRSLQNIFLNIKINTEGLKEIYQELDQVIVQFTSGILKLGQKLHENISQGSGENDSMVCYYQQLSNYLLRMSQGWGNIAFQLRGEILDPFEQFLTNFTLNSQRITNEAQNLIFEIEKNRDQLQRSQQEYWKLMSQAEKGSQEVERVVDAVDRGLKYKEDLIRASERSVKLKEVSQEAQSDYKRLVEITNKKTEELDSRWNDILEQANINNISRNAFSKQTIISILRVLASNNNKEELDIKLYLDKIKDIEYAHKDEVNDIRQYVNRVNKKSGVHFQSIKNIMEHFVSYETHKKLIQDQKNNEDKLKDDDLNSSWLIVGETMTDDDKNLINTYIENLKNQTRINTNQQESDSEDELSNNNRKRYNKQKLSVNDYQTVTYLQMKQSLKKSGSRSYFLSELKNSQISHLNDETFNDLGNLLKCILSYIELNDTIECEEVNKILYLSKKIYKRQYHYLSYKIAQSDFWRKTNVWFKIFDFLLSKVKTDQANNNPNQQKGLIKRGFGVLGKVIKGMAINTNQQQQQIQQQINQLDAQYAYLILEDINLYMINFQLPQQLSSDIIIALSLKNKIEKELLYQLLENQLKKTVKNSRKQHFSAQNIKNLKNIKFFQNTQKYRAYKLLFAVKKSLKYLSVQDNPFKILYVSREFNQWLQLSVKKFYFFNPQNLDCEQNLQQRQQYVQIILGIINSDLDYHRMKGKVGADINLDMSQQIEEIIMMDVQRSLHIHQTKLTQSVLQSILRTYAFFNRDVGYIQGMNYLAGYFFLLFNDEQLAYRAFDKIMERNFKKIWSKDFEDMKVMFYVFEQLVNIFLPQLGEHLRLQKVESAYYLPQWIITIYSCALQYTAKSSLLNIVWDMFLVESWKGFYKSTLFILKLFEDKILQMNFEDILHFISDFIRNEIFMVPQEYELIGYLKDMYNLECKSVKQEILKFKVTNRLISKLHQEHKDLIDLFKKKIKDYQI